MLRLCARATAVRRAGPRLTRRSSGRTACRRTSRRRTARWMPQYSRSHRCRPSADSFECSRRPGVIYGSVCSGIEAATVAWHPLGWRAAWYAEIDTFASAVLAHRFPEVRNLGDFTQIDAAAAGAVDLLVGGTPCQSFSLAGHRLGLDDPRGNLTLEFLRLAARARPRWVVWENVPGVLSIDGGRTFGTVLRTLADLGYGFAYRVLDAQFFGVPQRRRRVFVVGCLGGWQAAAAVLFERESLRRDLAPRRKARKRSLPPFCEQPWNVWRRSQSRPKPVTSSPPPSSGTP